jgi:hypothetical protein
MVEAEPGLNRLIELQDFFDVTMKRYKLLRRFILKNIIWDTETTSALTNNAYL